MIRRHLSVSVLHLARQLTVVRLQTLAGLMLCSAPSRAECSALLAGGHLVGVAPGGAAQAMLGLDWQHRTGFAAAALTAAVPVIAMNTENIELAYHTRQQTAIWEIVWCDGCRC